MVRNDNHYLVHIDEVAPKAVSESQGWQGMDIRFPLPEEIARSGGVALFRAVFRPGARHKPHRHPDADEFFYVIRGRAAIGTEAEEHDVTAGTVEFVSRGRVHWLRNLDPAGEVEVLGGYLGVGSLEEAGYEYVGEAAGEAGRDRAG
ncbi:MAG: cupin domain-containing protein [Candidatus Dormibacteraceae bacterium]